MNLFPVFIVGLAGSVHCAGMCGGVVSAFSLASDRVVPIARTGAVGRPHYVLAYNVGRIASYALAGALAGGAASGVTALAHLAAWQTAAYWLMNAMLALLGLYLMGAWQGLARVEAAGGILWRRLQPALRPLIPMDAPLKALALGAAWGWIPCGMVYSVLLTAMLSGSALNGAAVMAVFGLGTLPMLLVMGLFGARLRDWLRRRRLRALGGLLVLGFALLGLARAAGGVRHGWIDALCLV